MIVVTSERSSSPGPRHVVRVGHRRAHVQHVPRLEAELVEHERELADAAVSGRLRSVPRPRALVEVERLAASARAHPVEHEVGDAVIVASARLDRNAAGRRREDHVLFGAVEGDRGRAITERAEGEDPPVEQGTGAERVGRGRVTAPRTGPSRERVESRGEHRKDDTPVLRPHGPRDRPAVLARARRQLSAPDDGGAQHRRTGGAPASNLDDRSRESRERITFGAAHVRTVRVRGRAHGERDGAEGWWRPGSDGHRPGRGPRDHRPGLRTHPTRSEGVVQVREQRDRRRHHQTRHEARAPETPGVQRYDGARVDRAERSERARTEQLGDRATRVRGAKGGGEVAKAAALVEQEREPIGVASGARAGHRRHRDREQKRG